MEISLLYTKIQQYKHPTWSQEVEAQIKFKSISGCRSKTRTHTDSVLDDLKIVGKPNWYSISPPKMGPFGLSLGTAKAQARPLPSWRLLCPVCAGCLPPTSQRLFLGGWPSLTNLRVGLRSIYVIYGGIFPRHPPSPPRYIEDLSLSFGDNNIPKEKEHHYHILSLISKGYALVAR